MKKCIGCGNLIGDQVSKCCFCGYIYTQEALDKIEKEKQAEKQKLENQLIGNYQKKVNFLRLLWLIDFVDLICGVVLAFAHKNIGSPICIISFFVILCVCLIFSIFAITCPHCGKSLGKSRYFVYYKNCPYCGMHLYKR